MALLKIRHESGLLDPQSRLLNKQVRTQLVRNEPHSGFFWVTRAHRVVNYSLETPS